MDWKEPIDIYFPYNVLSRIGRFVCLSLCAQW